jgi:hypothetical protein
MTSKKPVNDKHDNFNQALDRRECSHQSPAIFGDGEVTFIWCSKPRGHGGSHMGEDIHGYTHHW